jgi:hypothetical protein
LPGFVDFLAGQADVGGGCFNVLVRNLEIAATAMLGDLAPHLGRVVFVGEAALCASFDFQCVGLCAKRPRRDAPSSRDRRPSADDLQLLLAGIM